MATAGIVVLLNSGPSRNQIFIRYRMHVKIFSQVAYTNGGPYNEHTFLKFN
jgi:hypothetical protein